MPIAFLIVVIFVALGAIGGVIAVCRMGFRFLLGRRWQLWYVRRSVDVALAAHFVLIVLTFVVDDTYSKWQNVTNDFHSLQRLEYLLLIDYYLGHFCPFVVAPSFLVAFVGYSIEQRIATQKEIDHTG